MYNLASRQVWSDDCADQESSSLSRILNAIHFHGDALFSLPRSSTRRYCVQNALQQVKPFPLSSDTNDNMKLGLAMRSG